MIIRMYAMLVVNVDIQTGQQNIYVVIELELELELIYFT